MVREPGLYVIDTNGSTYDTALMAFESCHPGSELAWTSRLPRLRLELPGRLRTRVQCPRCMLAR